MGLAVASLCLLLFLLSCGNRDDRDDIRNQRGEPDEIQTLGSDPFWRELWFYNRDGIGYEFRRTASCGSNREVYLFQSFNFVPLPDSTSASRPQGLKLPLAPESPTLPLSPN